RSEGADRARRGRRPRLRLMDRVRLGIVGCGNICQLNAPGYLAHPHMHWVGDIGEVSAIVGKSADFLQETPSVAHFRFKNGDCLGIIDYTYAPGMTIRSRYYRADEFFEIHGSRGIICVTRCAGEMLDLPPLAVIKG